MIIKPGEKKEIGKQKNRAVIGMGDRAVCVEANHPG